MCPGVARGIVTFPMKPRLDLFVHILGALDLSPCKHVVVQIFVEIERARLTRRLAAIREAEGNIDDAADTMQEVPVVRGDERWWGGWGRGGDGTGNGDSQVTVLGG